MSIVPQDPSSKTIYAPTPGGVANLILASDPDRLMAEVGGLLSYIAAQHEHPVTCDECRDTTDLTPCLMQEYATSIAIAWLMQRAGL